AAVGPTATPVPPTPTATSVPPTATPTPTSAPGGSIALGNPGFETGDETGWLSGGSAHGVGTTNPHSGSYAGYNNGGWNSVFQTVSGLQPNTTYTLTAWGRLGAASAGNNSAFYVANYGGAELRTAISGTSYQQYSISFTTGANTTSAEIGHREINGSATVTYYDDFALNGGSSTPPTATATPTATAQPSGQNVTRLRFFPRAGLASRMVGGRFSGSNVSPTSNFVTLASISSTPTDGQWNEITLSNSTTYRYIKYEAPPQSYGNLAEVEFYSGSSKLNGNGFGTAGSWNNGGNTFDKALDGNTASFFDAASGDDQYVGLDLGAAAQAAAPGFSPAPGTYSSAQTVTISSATSGASIRYTTNGSAPTCSTGTAGTSATVSATTTILAIACKSGLAASTVSAATYTIGSAPTPQPGGVSRVYHIGNSLTDTINYSAMRSLVQSKGNTYDFGRHMIPGAPLDWIWDHPDSGFQEAPYGYYPNALPNYTWDAVTLQPFDRGLEDDTTAAKKFIDLARQRTANSNTQFYIFSHWMRKNSDGTLDYDAAWLRQYTGGYDGTNETKDYYQDLVANLRSQTGFLAKPVLMVPVGDVLYELNQRMKRGELPGYSNVTQLYADGIHLNNVGQLATAATFYATVYKANPAGASYASYDIVGGSADRDITDALAAAIYDAVWDVVSVHPYAGVQ
ncbi:MAG: chitobiase/beta-hexosaminidase C-terminal domain-containing protein, partial [Roseiflexaceae bacterium]|nr:chitobiase/beta-hexosaminidase C-terminal domain-containing protein [Roseiflexaceae bacterium]